MQEDDWLEAAYEDRNGGDVDTATDYDVIYEEDLLDLCRGCGESEDECQCEYEEPWYPPRY